MRLKRFLFSYEFIEMFLFKSKINHYVLNPLPADAKLISIINSEKTRMLEVVIESNSFDEVTEGAEIPPDSIIVTDEEGYHKHLVDKI